MANPVLVEVTRGDLVESFHRGAIAIAGATGRLSAALGDVHAPVFPRSALKPIQAIPLIASGAADAFGLGPEEIALACASHSGEPKHTERIAAWLKRIGCTVDDLACGPHEIRDAATRTAMAARGDRPTPLHNNCSGKHTGFLTLARHLGVPIAGYEHIDHPVQRRVADTLRMMTGIQGEIPYGIDGCAVPNFALPLQALARALAHIADPRGLDDETADAARRILHAMRAHPDLVAGTGRVCTALMRDAGGHIAVKTGAEGVYAAILPDAGLGLALKIDDGATRAAETALGAILIAIGAADASGTAGALAHAAVRNTRGAIVGEIRPAGLLAHLPLGGGE